MVRQARIMTKSDNSGLWESMFPAIPQQLNTEKFEICRSRMAAIQKSHAPPALLMVHTHASSVRNAAASVPGQEKLGAFALRTEAVWPVLESIRGLLA